MKSFIKSFLRKHTKIEWGVKPIQHFPYVKITFFGIVLGEMQWNNLLDKWVEEKK